jgi:2-oxo-4-hydroxy-4-carboxy-5-ureidoimidazoline decarboxylase
VTTLKNLNAATAAEFVDAIGFAFEHSPWVAEGAAARRPFPDFEALHAALVAVVAEAPLAKQIALISAHPDLAGRVAREGRLTASSQSEQAAAGLETLTADEIARFEADNAAYRARFGFPFMICAREHDRASILAALEHRVHNERSIEIATALGEIAKIARLRLEGAIRS